VGVCGKSFPDFFGTKNDPTPLEPVSHWRVTPRGVLGLSPGILIIVLGIAVVVVALTVPLNYQAAGRRAFGGSFTVPVDLVLSLVGIVISIFGVSVLYGEIACLKQVEWKEVRKQETETH
jgi:hypothetical protein